MHTQIMKLRYIFATIATALCVLATSCKPEGPSYLSEVKVDSSWITLPADGGSKVITVNATDNWEIVDLPSWLTAAPMAGKAGETKVTFSAANAETHPDEIEKTFYIKSNGKKVGIKVVQGAAFTIANTPETAYTPEEAIAIYLAGKDLGTQVYVKGVVKSAAIDLAYGNAEFYLEENNDDYSFEFYRCLDFGGEKFTNDKKVKKGDVITAYGSLGIYKETIELLQGCVLISIEAPTGDNVEVVNEDELVAGKDGGNIVAKVIAQGGPLCVNTEAQDWISVSKTEIVDGVNLVTLAIAPNNGGARQGVISFSAGTKSVDANVSQAGNIAEVSVAEFLAAEVSGSAQYKISGFITDRTDISGHKFDLEQYGNFDITDATGNAYIYGVGAKGDIAKYGVKEGDIITLVGLRADYKGSAQMGSGQYESHKSVTVATAAEVNAMTDEADPKNPQNYVRVTGKVTNGTATGHKFDLATYGNFDLVDESGSLYVYGVSTGWNGETKKFGTLGVKEGDIITLVGYKTSYNGTNELVGMYISHEEGQPEPEEGLVHTSWYMYSSGEPVALITFPDETNCSMAGYNGTEWVFDDPDYGGYNGTYSYDPVSNSGTISMMEAELLLYKNAEGQLVLDGSSMGWSPMLFEQGEYIERPAPAPTSYVLTRDVINPDPDWAVTNYGSQKTDDIDSYLWFEVDKINYLACRICKPEVGGAYDNVNAIQMQGNANDATKMSRIGNILPYKKISKITVVTYNTGNYDPNFNIALGAYSPVVDITIPEEMVNAADMSTTKEELDGINKYTTVYTVSGDYKYFAIYKNTSGALYWSSITVE